MSFFNLHFFRLLFLLSGPEIFWPNFNHQIVSVCFFSVAKTFALCIFIEDSSCCLHHIDGSVVFLLVASGRDV